MAFTFTNHAISLESLLTDHETEPRKEIPIPDLQLLAPMEYRPKQRVTLTGERTLIFQRCTFNKRFCIQKIDAPNYNLRFEGCTFKDDVELGDRTSRQKGAYKSRWGTVEMEDCTLEGGIYVSQSTFQQFHLRRCGTIQTLSCYNSQFIADFTIEQVQFLETLDWRYSKFVGIFQATEVTCHHLDAVGTTFGTPLASKKDGERTPTFTRLYRWQCLGEADFKQSTFHHDLWMLRCTFRSDVMFQKSTFEGVAEFGESNVRRKNLDDSTKQWRIGNMTKAILELENENLATIFLGNANFSQCKFSFADFSECEFHGEAIFKESTFHSIEAEAWEDFKIEERFHDFRNTTFAGHASFSNITLEGAVLDFSTTNKTYRSGTSFAGNCSFSFQQYPGPSSELKMKGAIVRQKLDITSTAPKVALDLELAVIHSLHLNGDFPTINGCNVRLEGAHPPVFEDAKEYHEDKDSSFPHKLTQLRSGTLLLEGAHIQDALFVFGSSSSNDKALLLHLYDANLNRCVFRGHAENAQWNWGRATFGNCIFQQTEWKTQHGNSKLSLQETVFQDCILDEATFACQINAKHSQWVGCQWNQVEIQRTVEFERALFQDSELKNLHFVPDANPSRTDNFQHSTWDNTTWENSTISRDLNLKQGTFKTCELSSLKWSGSLLASKSEWSDTTWKEIEFLDSVAGASILDLRDCETLDHLKFNHCSLQVLDLRGSHLADSLLQDTTCETLRLHQDPSNPSPEVSPEHTTPEPGRGQRSTRMTRVKWIRGSIQSEPKSLSTHSNPPTLSNLSLVGTTVKGPVFQGATFLEEWNASRVHMIDLDLSSCNFRARVLWDAPTFSGHLLAHQAEFRRGLTLHLAKDGGSHTDLPAEAQQLKLDFSYAFFGETIDIAESKWKNTEVCFDGTQFHNSLKIRDTDCSRFSFQRCRFDGPVFLRQNNIDTLWDFSTSNFSDSFVMEGNATAYPNHPDAESASRRGIAGVLRCVDCEFRGEVALLSLHFCGGEGNEGINIAGAVFAQDFVMKHVTSPQAWIASHFDSDNPNQRGLPITQFRGPVFLRNISFQGGISCQRSSFSDSFLFESLHTHEGSTATMETSLGSLDFASSHFYRPAVFRGLTMEKSSNFENAHFAETLLFDNITLRQELFFAECEMSGAVKIRNTQAKALLRFNNAHFAETLLMDNLTLDQGACFSGCEFGGMVKVRDTQSQATLAFEEATFLGRVHLECLDQIHKLSFDNATLGQSILLEGSQRTGEEQDHLSLESAPSEYQPDTVLTHLSFAHARCEKNMYLQNIQWTHAPLETKSNETTNSKLLSFQGTKVLGNVHCLGLSFPNSSSPITFQDCRLQGDFHFLLASSEDVPVNFENLTVGGILYLDQHSPAHKLRCYLGHASIHSMKLPTPLSINYAKDKQRNDGVLPCYQPTSPDGTSTNQPEHEYRALHYLQLYHVCRAQGRRREAVEARAMYMSALEQIKPEERKEWFLRGQKEEGKEPSNFDRMAARWESLKISHGEWFSGYGKKPKNIAFLVFLIVALNLLYPLLGALPWSLPSILALFADSIVTPLGFIFVGIGVMPFGTSFTGWLPKVFFYLHSTMLGILMLSFFSIVIPQWVKREKLNDILLKQHKGLFKALKRR